MKKKIHREGRINSSLNNKKNAKKLLVSRNLYGNRAPFTKIHLFPYTYLYGYYCPSERDKISLRTILFAMKGEKKSKGWRKKTEKDVSAPWEEDEYTFTKIQVGRRRALPSLFY